MSWFAGIVWTLLFLYTAFKFVRCVRMVPTQSAYIVERLGKYHQTLGPGFHMLVPFMDKVAFIQDLKEESIEVPPQDCFTMDNVRVEVDGILYISVVNPENASYGVTNYRFAAIQLAQTTTRSVIGTLDLDRTFEEREAINVRVLAALADVSEHWGIRVHRYEVKNIVPPPSVRDAMERQMNAERDRRALLAGAEGQQQARINDSEGRKSELINRSEGEMRRRINEAEGKAAEILALAQATAESIEKVGEALALPGGVEATHLRLSQQYLGRLSALAQPRTQVLLPTDLTNMAGLLENLRLVDDDGGPGGQRALYAAPPARALGAPVAQAQAAPPVPAVAPPPQAPRAPAQQARMPAFPEPARAPQPVPVTRPAPLPASLRSAQGDLADDLTALPGELDSSTQPSAPARAFGPGRNDG